MIKKVRITEIHPESSWAEDWEFDPNSIVTLDVDAEETIPGWSASTTLEGVFDPSSPSMDGCCILAFHYEEVEE